MIEFLWGLTQYWIDFFPLTDVLTSLGVVFVIEVIMEFTRGKTL